MGGVPWKGKNDMKRGESIVERALWSGEKIVEAEEHHGRG